MITDGLNVPAASQPLPCGVITGVSEIRCHAPNGTLPAFWAASAASNASVNNTRLRTERNICVAPMNDLRLAVKNGRADPLPLYDSAFFSKLFLIYSLLQFGARAELRDFAGGDFDGGAGLWVAPVARFSLRHREGAEAYQSHPISFAEGGCNAVHRGINGSRGLRFADFTCARDLVNQIGLIHEILLAGLFSCPA